MFSSPRALAQFNLLLITVAQTVGGVRQLRTPGADPAATAASARLLQPDSIERHHHPSKDKVRSDKIPIRPQNRPKGLGRDPKPTRDKVTAEVTYIPGEAIRIRVTWGGLEFKRISRLSSRSRTQFRPMRHWLSGQYPAPRDAALTTRLLFAKQPSPPSVCAHGSWPNGRRRWACRTTMKQNVP